MEQSGAPGLILDTVDGWAIQVHNAWQIEVLRGAYAHTTGLEWVVEEDTICLWKGGEEEEEGEEVDGSILICRL